MPNYVVDSLWISCVETYSMCVKTVLKFVDIHRTDFMKTTFTHKLHSLILLVLTRKSAAFLSVNVFVVHTFHIVYNYNYLIYKGEINL